MEAMVSGDCTVLFEHVVAVRTSCLDTDFASQIKFTKLPLIHCFECTVLMSLHIRILQGKIRTFRSEDAPFTNPIQLMDLNNFVRKLDEYAAQVSGK